MNVPSENLLKQNSELYGKTWTWKQQNVSLKLQWYSPSIQLNFPFNDISLDVLVNVLTFF